MRKKKNPPNSNKKLLGIKGLESTKFISVMPPVGEELGVCHLSASHLEDRDKPAISALHPHF